MSSIGEVRGKEAIAKHVEHQVSPIIQDRFFDADFVSSLFQVAMQGAMNSSEKLQFDKTLRCFYNQPITWGTGGRWGQALSRKANGDSAEDLRVFEIYIQGMKEIYPLEQRSASFDIKTFQTFWSCVSVGFANLSKFYHNAYKKKGLPCTTEEQGNSSKLKPLPEYLMELSEKVGSILKPHVEALEEEVDDEEIEGDFEEEDVVNEQENKEQETRSIQEATSSSSITKGKTTQKEDWELMLPTIYERIRLIYNMNTMSSLVGNLMKIKKNCKDAPDVASAAVVIINDDLRNTTKKWSDIRMLRLAVSLISEKMRSKQQRIEES